jgi:hypothetical protein
VGIYSTCVLGESFDPFSPPQQLLINHVRQLASNHTQFVEKICDMFDTMNNRLPVYEQLVDQFSVIAPRLNEAANGRLRRALAYVYSDLIQFCYDICKLFSRKRSSKYSGTQASK